MKSLQFASALLMAAFVTGTPAKAEDAWKPSEVVEIIAGTNAGTGFDRTARMFQKIAQEDKLVEAPMVVLNKPGGSGAIGYAYLNRHPGDGHYISVISPLILTNKLSGANDLNYADVTPLTVLMGDEIIVAVKSDSPFKTGDDLLKKLKVDPASVSIGLSGLGGQNHIAIGLVGKAAGVDIKNLKIVALSGSSQALTAALGGHVEVFVGPASTAMPHIEAETMRGLGIASSARLEGVLASVPTWKEQGMDVVFSNWRGFTGPSGMTPAQIAYWDGVFAKVSQAKGWKDDLATNFLTAQYLDSAQTKAFLAAQNDALAAVLKDLGFSE